MHNSLQDRSGVGAKFAMTVGLILVVAATGLTIYGGFVRQDQQMVEKILPDSQFAR